MKLALITRWALTDCLPGQPKRLCLHFPALKWAPLILLAPEISAAAPPVSLILRIGKPMEQLNEEELSQIVRFASTAASLSTEKPGGISAIPSYTEILNAI